MYFVEIVDALGEFSKLCAGVGYVGLFKFDLVLPNVASCSYLGGRRTSNSQRITLKKAFRNLTSRCMHAPHALPARAALTRRKTTAFRRVVCAAQGSKTL